ncbi:bifunctional 2-keto-4-hydroxyglutarate aldolase/2-keto-3-deoxy-6-phosphogluconate aldolase [Pseudobacteroides cellulosolvens]|uniref:2-dehydro-3-deoxyphosphogluconate aldolase/4-hydroxy-2-oxoglutarate aldolase n=1 Tax=Pseudobacteroides cellulosolvens ATCC 35603 = DSM 2933 TaxID=398512 RepID=A0A0L6JQB4_9FIRM|nr:bifunctional 2-keto-4-hydroxyglutarate aldolase/2-keto-3-deoxy-6-phosphogluconate aldolase [Pseudobacteroides cellulosolvens]KNY28031.1 2-dehydro-3-deoxyphosphogluconate aldolase/4-hydroxy-2-oxoglutarate aldolase [Pseudobacteroides cellulosolvens ATCC 35603 = DSM 2933]
MNKQEILSKIKEGGLVAVVRADNAEMAFKIADACIEGGVASIEITYTVPGATEIIKELSRRYSSGEIIIGAGTVMDSETARTAILAGAQYIVSPYLSKEVVKICNRYQIASMPGAMTVREAVECLEAGADIIKVFPGEVLGPTFIKAVKGPMPYAVMMPTGGVTLENVGEWIKAGAVAVGAGGSLTAGAKKGDYNSITELAKKFIDEIKKARNQK